MIFTLKFLQYSEIVVYLITGGHGNDSITRNQDSSESWTSL